jgi:hypothetical protein
MRSMESWQCSDRGSPDVLCFVSWKKKVFVAVASFIRTSTSLPYDRTLRRLPGRPSRHILHDLLVDMDTARLKQIAPVNR